MTLFRSDAELKRPEEMPVKIEHPFEKGVRLLFEKSPELPECKHAKGVIKVVITEDFNLGKVTGKVGDIYTRCIENCGWWGISERIWLGNITFAKHVDIIDARALSKNDNDFNFCIHDIREIHCPICIEEKRRKRG